MGQIILEKKQAFANLSAVQRKIDDCMEQLKLNSADSDQFIILNRDLNQLHQEWRAEYKKYMALEKQFTELVQIRLAKLMLR
jgi:hypothetical protein